MSSIFIYSLGSVIAVSLVSFVGLFTISMNEKKLRKSVVILVALATGALLGDAFLHLIPEAFEDATNTAMTSLFIIAGMVVFFVLEKVLSWHHHSAHDESEHSHVDPIGKLILVSDGFHNFIDGVIIGASYLVSVPVGIASTVAILLHEIPQEIGDFGVLLHAGYPRRRALVLNFVSALLAVLGTLLVFLVGESAGEFVELFVPFSAGVFIYIAASDLVPELHKRHSLKSTVAELLVLALGVLAMYLLLFLE